MPSSPSPSSSVQAARQALANRLREVLKDAGLTGRALAAQAHWGETKVSRILNAVMPPSAADIRTWCQICGVDALAEDLVAASRAADSMYEEWLRIHRTGMRRAQERSTPLYESTRLMRTYCSNVVPGLLQTPAYASALMSSITHFQGTPDDVADAVKARIARSNVIRDGGHRFAILVEETVLRRHFGDDSVMAAQLGYLLDIMTLPRVRFGVIPFTAPRKAMWPLVKHSTFSTIGRSRWNYFPPRSQSSHRAKSSCT